MRVIATSLAILFCCTAAASAAPSKQAVRQVAIHWTNALWHKRYSQACRQLSRSDQAVLMTGSAQTIWGPQVKGCGEAVRYLLARDHPEVVWSSAGAGKQMAQRSRAAIQKASITFTKTYAGNQQATIKLNSGQLGCQQRGEWVLMLLRGRWVLELAAGYSAGRDLYLLPAKTCYGQSASSKTAQALKEVLAAQTVALVERDASRWCALTEPISVGALTDFSGTKARRPCTQKITTRWGQEPDLSSSRGEVLAAVAGTSWKVHGGYAWSSPVNVVSEECRSKPQAYPVVGTVLAAVLVNRRWLALPSVWSCGYALPLAKIGP